MLSKNAHGLLYLKYHYCAASQRFQRLIQNMNQIASIYSFVAGNARRQESRKAISPTCNRDEQYHYHNRCPTAFDIHFYSVCYFTLPLAGRCVHRARVRCPSHTNYLLSASIDVEFLILRRNSSTESIDDITIDFKSLLFQQFNKTLILSKIFFSFSNIQLFQEDLWIPCQFFLISPIQHILRLMN